MEIIIPVITLGVLGLLFGIGLAVASKKFHVDIDPRLEKISGLLPGSNCGACGKAGCFGFAESLVDGASDVDTCRVSEDAMKEQISKILGKKLEKKAKIVAICHCGGANKVKDKFIYQGLSDCVAANLIFKGQKECIYGCLGFGTCVRVCPFGAIAMSKDNLPSIDVNKCKACNKCVITCPKKLFSLIPITSKIIVSCRSHDVGRDVKVICSVGCIGCKLCEKVCKFDAIHVVDNLAVIDYTKCTSCGACVKACPMKTIQFRQV